MAAAQPAAGVRGQEPGSAPPLQLRRGDLKVALGEMAEQLTVGSANFASGHGVTLEPREAGRGAEGGLWLTVPQPRRYRPQPYESGEDCLVMPESRPSSRRAAVAVAVPVAVSLCASGPTALVVCTVVLLVAAVPAVIALGAAFARSAERHAAAHRTLLSLLRLAPWYARRR